MFANFMIGIREGLEAALIIGILVAYLKKTSQQSKYRFIALGVLAALATAVLAGLGLTFLDEQASDHTEILITGTTSLLAVAFVTWMVFWMAKTSKNLSKEIHSKMEEASNLSLFVIAYLTVVREGVETSIFLWTAAKTTGEGQTAWLGAIVGILAAAVLGYWIFKGMLRINLGKFFQYTGTYLLVLTAGIFAYAIGEFTELGFLPETQTAYDLSGITPEGSVLEVTLKGTLGYNPTPTVLQVAAWATFLVISVGIYLRQYRRTARKLV